MTQPLHSAHGTVGKYEIVEKIGEGGYSSVFRGFDPLIKRHVAIKSCPSSNRETRDRFYREAEIAGNLDHPNIVRIYDLFVENDAPYLVQELLDGEDLDDKIERRELTSFGEKLYTLIQIARGLNYAHRQGVVHRDIKPANVRILEDGTAKILDFGIAKLVHHTSNLTRAGMAVGTAAYLAPEQIRGHKAGPGTDVFAFGVVAYELLTYVRPFGRETISETFFQTLNHDPEPLVTHWPGCPPELVTVVSRCLEKDPERRYGSAAEVLTELEAIRDRQREDRATLADPSKTQLIPTGFDLDLDLGHAPAASPGRSVISTAPIAAPKTPQVDLPLQERPRGLNVGGTTQKRPQRLGWTLFLTLVLAAVVAAWLWLPIGEVVNRAGQWLFELTDDSAAAVVNVAPPRPSEASENPAAPESAAPVAKPAASAARAAAPPAAEAADLRTEPQVSETETAEVKQAEVASSELPTGKPATSETGTLAFTGVWTSGIRLSIDGMEPIVLGRNQNLQIEPGPHSLTFSIDDSGYQTSQSVRTRVTAGETQTIEMPIESPGRLTVQAHLGSPQALVQIGTQRLLRPTPLRALRVKPGRYRIAIFDHQDRTAPVLQTVVDLKPRHEAIVTFDIENDRGPHVREKRIEP